LAAVIDVIAKEAGSRSATRWRRRILDRLALLRSRPLLGAIDEDIGPGRRRLVVAPYLIVYEFQSATEVVILRIVHGARDLRAVFNDIP
jgi:plasmid stabilization system protein ParE